MLVYVFLVVIRKRNHFFFFLLSKLRNKNKVYFSIISFDVSNLSKKKKKKKKSLNIFANIFLTLIIKKKNCCKYNLNCRLMEWVILCVLVNNNKIFCVILPIFFVNNKIQLI